MKITKSRLKQLIKEELANINVNEVWSPEGADPYMEKDANPAVEKLANEMESIINDIGTFDKSSFTKAAAQLLGNYAGTKYEDAAWVIVDRRRGSDDGEDSFGNAPKVSSYEDSEGVDV
tara:strand:+ start:515 stop:871 length:357 start_codon:yes stop_codon:yes gene_type:complete